MKTIFKLAIALLALFSFAACSDVPMPYDEPGTSKNDSTNTETGTYLDETFETSFGKFTNVTVKGNAWVIDFKTAKATGYDNSSKTTTASEAYLVSAPVDLSKSTAAYLQFDYILRYVRAGQTENKVLITDNYTGNPSTTTWTDITGTLTEGSDWTTFSTYSKNIPTAFLGKSNVVVALMYSCTTTSSTIEIKNLVMKDGKVEESGETPVTPGTDEKGQSKDNPYTVQEAVNLITSGKAPSTEVYVKGIVSNVDFYNTNYKSLTYYISDDGKSKAMQIYSGKGLNGADFASKEDLKVGQAVVVKGIIKSFTDKNGNKINEMDKNSQIVSIEGSGTETPDTPDTPTTGDAMNIDNIKSNKTGNVSLDTNKYGSQSVSDENTWYSWTFDGITYQGAKICISDGKNGEGLQMQGNASDASKMGFLFNKTAFSKSIKSITLVLSVATSSKYDPSFDLYAGTEAHPKGTAISATPKTATAGNYKEYTYVFDLSNGDYKYFTLANDKVGAIYVKSLKVTLK